MSTTMMMMIIRLIEGVIVGKRSDDVICVDDDIPIANDTSNIGRLRESERVSDTTNWGHNIFL